MSVRLAVFDCDGTLFDGQASICDAMEAAFGEFDLECPPRGSVRRAVGLSLPQAVRTLAHQTAPDVQRGIVEAYKRHFRDARSSGSLSQQLFPGTVELIDSLRAGGWELAVATGMSDRGLTHCLAAHNITDRFVSLQTADRHPSKPHPAMLEAALFEAGAATSDSVMIGDTAYDMAMASAIGVRAIGVDWGYHDRSELIAAGAEWIAATQSELREYLLK